jgi:hypothetical protein
MFAQTPSPCSAGRTSSSKALRRPPLEAAGRHRDNLRLYRVIERRANDLRQGSGKAVRSLCVVNQEHRPSEAHWKRRTPAVPLRWERDAVH